MERKKRLIESQYMRTSVFLYFHMCIIMYALCVCVSVFAGCLQTPVGLSFCPDGGVALACSDSISYRNRAAHRYLHVYVYVLVHVHVHNIYTCRLSTQVS